MGVELWIVLAIAAALAQTARNTAAQSLAMRISPALNSWSRFTFCLPFAAATAAIVTATDGWPSLPPAFFLACTLTAIAQLLGNVALIGAFRAGRFAESIVFHKLEVILTAIAGALFFAERPSAAGLVGIVLCGLGVIVMNLARSDAGRDWTGALHPGRAGGLALLCAGLLVVASFALKQANLIVSSANQGIDVGDFAAPVQTLFHTTWIEVLLLSAWIAWREPGSFRSVSQHWPRMALIGSAGFGASLCWFWAYSLTLVAYVKAVGQIEALLAVAVGIRLLGERDLVRQLPGVGLVVAGIALVLLG